MVFMVCYIFFVSLIWLIIEKGAINMTQKNTYLIFLILLFTSCSPLLSQKIIFEGDTIEFRKHYQIKNHTHIIKSKKIVKKYESLNIKDINLFICHYSKELGICLICKKLFNIKETPDTFLLTGRKYIKIP